MDRAPILASIRESDDPELVCLLVDKESKELIDQHRDNQKDFHKGLTKFFDERGFLTEKQKSALRNEKTFERRPYRRFYEKVSRNKRSYNRYNAADWDENDWDLDFGDTQAMGMGW